VFFRRLYNCTSTNRITTPYQGAENKNNSSSTTTSDHALFYTTVSKLCLYGEFLSRSFKSVNFIQNYISGVKTLHLLAGFEFPSENWFSVKLLYRGLAE
jgi:hypothetical protein